MSVNLAIITSTATSWGLTLSDQQIEQFAIYANELQRWNKQVNLTTITTPEAIAVRHFLDSLHCALAWGDVPDTMIDIGSGAGFPGLPLKILYPTLQLTLVETIAKKTAFLEHISRYLILDGVTIIRRRAEDLGHDLLHRERYDVVTARAVAELRVLAEYCLPCVRVGGRFLAPKGPRVDTEIEAALPALTMLGGTLTAVEPVLLPGQEPRTLVVITKTTATPSAYPRAVGAPARRPL